VDATDTMVMMVLMVLMALPVGALPHQKIPKTNHVRKVGAVVVVVVVNEEEGKSKQ